MHKVFFHGCCGCANRWKHNTETFQINTIPSEEATFLEPLPPKQLAQLRLELGLDTNQFCVLIIDKISTCTPTLLGAVDARLQQATGSLKRFGGLSVLLFGDFNQLRPVKGSGLASAAVDVVIYDVSNENKKNAINTTSEETGVGVTN